MFKLIAGRQLPIGKFTKVQERVLNQGMLNAVREESVLSMHGFVLYSAYHSPMHLHVISHNAACLYHLYDS